MADAITTLEEMSSRYVKSKWRRELHRLTSFTCNYCGRVPSENIDHITPKHKGGCEAGHNLIAVCLRCNRSKGHEDFSTWYRRQEFYSERREQAVLAWMQGDQSLCIEIGRETVEALNQKQVAEAIERWNQSYVKKGGKQKGSNTIA